MKYGKVVLDLETTGLNVLDDEILQVTIIDQGENVLINEYCKPKNVTEWENAEKINNITPAMVSDKRPFDYFIEEVRDILNNAEEVIIYNADFELAFLDKYGIEVNSKIYDLMISFAEVYGDFNEYYGNYTWKSLDTCCLYYGYYLDNAHNSLEDCKATLYCYNSLIANKCRYRATEHIGKTLKEFISDIKKIVTNKRLDLYIRNELSLESKRRKEKRIIYFDEFLKEIDDIPYKSLLDCKILDLNFNNFTSYDIYVERCVEAELDIQDKEIKRLKKQLENTYLEIEGKNIEINQLKKQISKLQNKNKKLEEELGIVEKPKIYMFNSYGYYTAEYCRSTGKPMFKSKGEYEPFANNLLSKTRCKVLKMPVKDDEEIYAFYKVQNGYCALYFRNIK